MGRIVGVVCDNCKTLDIEIFNYEDHSGPSEDTFPRRGWITLTQWEEVEDKRYAQAIGPDIHICSPQCLKEFGQSYANESYSHEEHGHSHD